MRERKSVTTLTVCAVALMLAAILAIALQLCYQPSAASQSSKEMVGRQMFVFGQQAVINKNQATKSNHQTARSQQLITGDIRPTTDDRRLAHERFYSLCNELEARVGGTVTVALSHDNTTYYYPNELAARESRRAASVIKLQIVACYLTTITDTMLGTNPPELALCRKAISVSDNDAANRLMDTIGIATVNRYNDILEYTDTKLMRHFNEPLPPDEEPCFNQTSAADQVQFLKDLWEGRILTGNERALMLGWMRHNERRSKIPRHFGRGYEVYNKTGETWQPPVQNDVAIVTKGDEVWYLAILTSGATVSDEPVRAGIADLAKDLVDSFDDDSPTHTTPAP